MVTMIVTAGQCGDAPQGERLLDSLPSGKVGHVVADAVYDSDAIRQRIKKKGAKACLKPYSKRKVKKRYDKTRYRNRNVIERFFGHLKCFRRLATRYEKKAANFTGFLWLGAILPWI